MLHDLLAMDLTGWHPRDNIPKTAAKADQQELSLAPEERWLAGFLTSGMLPYATAKYPSRVRHRSKMYEAARAIHELRFGWHDARFLKFLESWGVKAVYVERRLSRIRVASGNARQVREEASLVRRLQRARAR